MTLPTHDGTAATCFPEMVSFFHSAFSQEPDEQLPLGTIFQRIQSGEWESRVVTLRRMLEQNNRKGYDDAKRKLPAFCVSGACFTRDKEQTLAEKFIEHSGFLQADLDRKDNAQLSDIEEVKAFLRTDPHVAGFFVSPSGEGLKCLVRIEADVTKHAASFAAVEKHFLEKYGLQIDRSTKDPLRLCFVSHDPMPWLNLDARILSPLDQPKKAASETWHPPSETTSDDIAEMLRFIPPKPAYDDWLRISSAVWSVLPLEEGTRLLMSWSSEDKPGEYAEKWKARLKQIGVGTLVHYAQQHGFDARAAARRRRWCGRIRFAEGDRTAGAVEASRLQDVDPAMQPRELTQEFVRDCLDRQQRGDAELFGAAMKGLMCYDHKAQCWRSYDRGVWERDDTEHTRLVFMETVTGAYQQMIDKLAQAMIDDEAPKGKKDPRAKEADLFRQRIAKLNSKGYAEAALDLASSMLAAVATEFDADPHLAACENGTVDLEIGDFREHRASDRITLRLPVRFDIEAGCPSWEAFLNLIFENDQDTIAFVRRAVGYSLSGLVSADTLFFLLGSGANGKSTFRTALEMLFGEYTGGIAIGSLLTNMSDSNVDYQKARLKGRRLVFTDEIPDGKKFNESQIKAITGGDPILARNPYEKPFEFIPTHKLWLIGNHKPAIAGTDLGIWRRICLIPFHYTIPESERRPRHQVLAEFRAELPGILNWALRGWVDFLEQGLNPPDPVKAATSEYKSEQDQFGQFMEECLEKCSTDRVSTAAVYKTYVKWCEENGEIPRYKSKNKVTSFLKETGHVTSQDRDKVSYLDGYRLPTVASDDKGFF